MLIGIDTCQGYRACYYVGTDPAVVSIGDGSCQGDYACTSLGQNYAPNLEIGSGSCLGREACRSLGAQRVDITVGDTSCIGWQACRSFGYSSDLIHIGNGACVGREDDGVTNSGGRSCYYFGYDSDAGSLHPNSITVADQSCVGSSSNDTTEICQSCYAGVSLASVTIPNDGAECVDAIAE